MEKRISVRLILGLAAVTVLAVALPARAKGAASACGFNVTSIIADTDSNNLPFQLQSDGKGSYVTYTNSKADSATSQIQSNSCDWLLDTTTSGSRAVTLSLTYPASNNSPKPPFATATVRARFITQCGANPLNNGISYGTMTAYNQTLDCGLRIGEISYGGNTYAVAFNPTSYAGSNWVHATCTGVQNSLCNAWTTTPPPNAGTNSAGQPAAIGELVQVSTAKGKNVDTPLGLYYVSFGITITK